MVKDRQVKRLFRLLSSGKTLGQAADKAGMDEKTARKYRELGRLPSEVGSERTWRTRLDPFAEVWPEVHALLQEAPGLEAKTLFTWLKTKYPEKKFDDSQLRTFQRGIKRWRATAGPAKEVFFSQVHQPGRLCASDFTHMKSLAVTIGSQPFDHLVYHFGLTYSNWESVTICFSESFESHVEKLLIEQISGGDSLTSAAIAQQAAKMRFELFSPAPTPLEKIAIERIVITWLALQHAELSFLQAQQDVRWARYWLARQAQADRLHRAAVGSLLAIRELLPVFVQPVSVPNVVDTGSQATSPEAKEQVELPVPAENVARDAPWVKNRIAGLMPAPDGANHLSTDEPQNGKPKLNGHSHRLQGFLEPCEG